MQQKSSKVNQITVVFRPKFTVILMNRPATFSWDAMYEGHDTAKLEEALRVGKSTQKPCKSVYITAPETCNVFEMRRKELSKGKMNLSYEHNEL